MSGWRIGKLAGLSDTIKLLFLVVSYNYILYSLSKFLPVDLFPNGLEDLLLLFSFVSALYLAWLFGYREKTVIWLAYAFLFQVFGLALVRRDYEVIAQFVPSLLLSLLLIWLFESPVEKRTRRLEEERKRLEDDLRKNSEEISTLLERISLLKELLESLKKEKSALELELSRLEEEETSRRRQLEKEIEMLSLRLRESQRRLEDYEERLERLVEVNRELFQMLEAMQSEQTKEEKGELSKLRQEKRRLSKELFHMQELLEELSRENLELSRRYEALLLEYDRERRERERLEVEVENLSRQIKSRKEIYREVLSSVLENVEFEDRALEEFIDLSLDAKREFLKELILLDLKGEEEKFEVMHGYRKVFKLKPVGGRIYFTFGEKKRWKVIGMLWGEGDERKNRYVRDVLIKYKD